MYVGTPPLDSAWSIARGITAGSGPGAENAQAPAALRGRPFLGRPSGVGHLPGADQTIRGRPWTADDGRPRGDRGRHGLAHRHLGDCDRCERGRAADQFRAVLENEWLLVSERCRLIRLWVLLIVAPDAGIYAVLALIGYYALLAGII
jgi:hypothetical protein